MQFRFTRTMLGKKITMQRQKYVIGNQLAKSITTARTKSPALSGTHDFIHESSKILFYI